MNRTRLLSCSDRSVLLQDFIGGLMKMEESKAKEIQKHISTNDPSGTSPTATGDQDRPDTSDSTTSSYLSTLTKEDLCSPVIFVRKWIGEVSSSITLFPKNFCCRNFWNFCREKCFLDGHVILSEIQSRIIVFLCSKLPILAISWTQKSTTLPFDLQFQTNRISISIWALVEVQIH